MGTVTGTVTLDGKPVSNASVQLWPKDDVQLDMCAGTTNEAGRFELKNRLKPEAKPGAYIALVTREVKKDGTLPGPQESAPQLAAAGALRNSLPAIYSDRQMPVFTFEVKPGPNEFALELKSK
jgi:hypothetical protein